MVKIRSKPKGAKIFINDSLTGRTDTTMRLIASPSLRLRLVKETYEQQTYNLSIIKDSTIELLSKLDHTNEFKDSMKNVRKKRMKTIQIVRRISFGALATYFGGTGIFYNFKTEQATKAYNSDNSADQSVHEADWQNIKKNESLRNTMYSLAGICILGLCFSIPF